MKTNLLFVAILLSLAGWRCSPDKPVVSPKFDFDKTSTQLMKDLAPQIVGQWKLRQVQVKYRANDYYQTKANITKDSTLRDLATLTIVPAAVPRTSPRDLRRGEYDGTIQYRNKTYPIQFDLMANPDWLVHQKGPQAFFLFDYHFPVGSHLTESEEAFLQNIGLIGDNFSLETTLGQPTMIWRGLNRGINQIDLVRQ